MTKEKMLNTLEENRELIENKDFESFYGNIYSNERPYFTDLFLKSGINPLEYMKKVPECFAHSLENLEFIDIPDNIEIIEYEAFFNCSKLTNIEIPNSVKTIGNFVFQNCTNLKSIIIPDTVKNIGWYAFSNCNNLTIYCSRNSYAEQYAKGYHIPCKTTLNEI